MFSFPIITIWLTSTHNWFVNVNPLFIARFSNRKAFVLVEWQKTPYVSIPSISKFDSRLSSTKLPSGCAIKQPAAEFALDGACQSCCVLLLDGGRRKGKGKRERYTRSRSSTTTMRFHSFSLWLLLVYNYTITFTGAKEKWNSPFQPRKSCLSWEVKLLAWLTVICN